MATLNETWSHGEVRNTTEWKYTYNWRNFSDRQENILVQKNFEISLSQMFSKWAVITLAFQSKAEGKFSTLRTPNIFTER